MKILIGVTGNNEAVELKLNIDEHFSLSGSIYNFDEIFTEETGEQAAREMLEDGEQWKMAVEADNTTDSLDGWINHVLSIDGWQHVLGDIEDVGDGERFCRLDGCGQIDMGMNWKSWNKLVITEHEKETIRKAWKKLHLKDMKKMSAENKKLVEQVKQIFQKYEGKFELKDLLEEDD